MEITGPVFERVFAYGQQKMVDLPPAAREQAVLNHVKAWAAATMTPRGVGELLFRDRMQASWKYEGQRIVGVIVHV